MKSLARWLWRRKTRLAAIAAASGFVLLNVVAYMHAHAMTHFADSGTRTSNPEHLSFAQKLRVLFTGITVPRPACDATPASVGLDFEVRRLPGPDGDIEAWVIDHAESKGRVLLFHGYAACKSNVLAEAAAIHEAGYSVMLVDFRGSGGSAGRVTTLGMNEADDVARVCTFARDEWPDEPLVLFGQSMGGAACLRATAVGGVTPDAMILEAPFDRLLSTVSNRFHTMGLPAFPLAQLLVFWGGAQHGFNGFRHNPSDYAESATCPTLFLHGDADRSVTVDQATSLFERLGGTKRFESFPGVGHESLIKSDGERWRQCVSEFLDEVAAARSASAAGKLDAP